LDELDFAASVSAAAEEMRRKGVHKETIQIESLPPEVRKELDELRARLDATEGFLNALIREATNKLKDVA
jgi:hypothetical protein